MNLKIALMMTVLMSAGAAASLLLEADYNRDNRVDPRDVSLLAENWLLGARDLNELNVFSREWLLDNGDDYAVDIYVPPANISFDGSSYPRLIHHGDNALLCTFTRDPLPGEAPFFPLYRSTDGGRSWQKISEIRDTHNGSPSARWGLRWTPVLFEIPRNIPGATGGTLLCAGLSVSPNWHTVKIELYRSTDAGLSWQYLSTVAEGIMPAETGTPVWEPFLVLDDSDRLLCFFSDERDPLHNQKIAHRVSTNGGFTWGGVVDDVALGVNLRPGMPVVSRMPNGMYIMVYEIVELPGNPIHYRISADPANWGNPFERGSKLTSIDGVTPGSSPFVVSGPYEGGDSIVIVSAMFQSPGSSRGSDNFVNFNNGSGPWYRMQNPLTYSGDKNGYSRSLLISRDHSTLYSVAPVNHTPGKSKIRFDQSPLEVISGLSYRMMPASNPALCADVAEASTVDGANILQWHILDSTNQAWTFRIADEIGPHVYYSVIACHSGKNMAVGGGTTLDEATVLQWRATGNHPQQWRLDYEGGGLYRIIVRHSEKVLEVDPAWNGAGANIRQNTYSGSANQKWLILPVTCGQ